MILFFSGTGNSEYVAKRMGEGLQDELLNLTPKMREKDYSELSSEKPWIVVAPTYAWQLPKVVKKWLIRTKLLGSSEIYFILTCESQVGDAAGYLKAICEHKQLSYKGTGKVIMPLNMYTVSKIPNEEQALEIVDSSEEHISELIYYIKQGEELPEFKEKSFSKTKSSGVNRMFYRLFKNVLSDKKFFVTEACVGCGNCEKVCPLGNVRLNEEKKPEWHGECTQCLGCISRCPVGAIEYGKKTEGKEKYFCPKLK